MFREPPATATLDPTFPGGRRVWGWRDRRSWGQAGIFLPTPKTKKKQPLLCTYPIVLNNQRMLWSLNGSCPPPDLIQWSVPEVIRSPGYLDQKKRIRWCIQGSSVAVQLRFSLSKKFFVCSSGTNKLFSKSFKALRQMPSALLPLLWKPYGDFIMGNNHAARSHACKRICVVP